MALAAIRGEQTLVELSQQFDVHATQIKQWKDQLLEGATGVFGDEAKAEPAGPTVDVKTLHAKIGELTLENDFFIRCAWQGGIAGRKEMIDREHKLSVSRQAKLFGFSRGSVYYRSRPVCDGDLALMRRIDELHLDYPFARSRMLQGLLRGEGLEAGRLHIATLMKKMGIEAIYRRPNCGQKVSTSGRTSDNDAPECRSAILQGSQARSKAACQQGRMPRSVSSPKPLSHQHRHRWRVNHGASLYCGGPDIGGCGLHEQSGPSGSSDNAWRHPDAARHGRHARSLRRNKSVRGRSIGRSALVPGNARTEKSVQYRVHLLHGSCHDMDVKPRLRHNNPAFVFRTV